MDYGVLWTRAELKNNARFVLQGSYGGCVLAALVASILTGINTTIRADGLDIYVSAGMVVSINLIVLVFGVFLGNVLKVGIYRFFVENRDYKAPASKLLFGFQGPYYGNIVITMLLMDIKIFLWTLLFVFPGIIKSYEYRMVPYILAEQPDIPQSEAFAISKEMMMNQKFEAFALDVSFFFWNLLSVVTCGLAGIFWVFPYTWTTDTELYVVLRNHWMEKRNHVSGENF